MDSCRVSIYGQISDSYNQLYLNSDYSKGGVMWSDQYLAAVTGNCCVMQRVGS